jgi:hypothetical protein
VLIGIMIGLGLWTLLPQSDEIPGEELDEIPVELRGTWITDVEAYQGRFMEIGAKDLRLGFGSEAPDAYFPLISIHRRDEGGFSAYVLEYFDPEGQQLLELHMTYDGDLRLRNPSEVVWRKR